METTEKLQDYIRLYKVYEYAMFYKEQDPDYIFPKEADIFLKLQKELNINSVEEAKKLIASSRNSRVTINQMKREILELQRELNHLDTIKEEQLSKSGLYIHNIKFGGNRIDYKKSDDEYWYVNLPYTNENMYIPKTHTAYNEKQQFYTLFLVDDKEYKLYDENGKVIRTITGEELDNHVMNKKKEIDKSY